MDYGNPSIIGKKCFSYLMQCKSEVLFMDWLEWRETFASTAYKLFISMTLIVVSRFNSFSFKTTSVKR
jgi:hypothetical protein